MRISVPSDGAVGGTPTPRNDSVASVMMAMARWMVAITSTGPMTLGRMWRRRMVKGPMPIRRAACTYSLLRSTSVEPRTVRAYCTPARNADREDQDVQRQLVVHVARQQAARHAVDQQRHQDGGKRELHVGDAHDDAVDPSARIAADQPERDAQDHGEQHRGKAHQQRDARAIQDGRQDIAALVVGAQHEERCCRRLPRPAACWRP